MKYVWTLLASIVIVIFWMWYAFQEKYATLSKNIPLIDQINNWQNWLLIMGFLGVCVLVISIVFKNKQIALTALVIEIIFASFIITTKATTVDQNDSQYARVSKNNGKYQTISTSKIKYLATQNNKYLVYVYTDKNMLATKVTRLVKAQGYLLRIYKVKPNANLNQLIFGNTQPNALIINGAQLIIVGQESLVKVADNKMLKTIENYYQ